MGLTVEKDVHSRYLDRLLFKSEDNSCMTTSSEVVKSLDQALTNARNAINSIDNLIVEHDYQDVALLITQAATALLESAMFMMQSNDEEGFGALERADDILDAVYDIIDSELDDTE
jgi:hypothetical protein